MGRMSCDFKTQRSAPKKTNKMFYNTMLANGNIYGFQTGTNRNSFNCWNSVEINQFYMN